MKHFAKRERLDIGNAIVAITLPFLLDLMLRITPLPELLADPSLTSFTLLGFILALILILPASFYMTFYKPKTFDEQDAINTITGFTALATALAYLIVGYASDTLIGVLASIMEVLTSAPAGTFLGLIGIGAYLLIATVILFLIWLIPIEIIRYLAKQLATFIRRIHIIA